MASRWRAPRLVKMVVEHDVDRALDGLCTASERPPRVVVSAVLTLVLEIAHEGHEGRPVGTLFTVGNADAVLAHSRALILAPLAGHVPASTGIVDRQLRGTLKQLAFLDGAFVVADDGRVVRAFRAGEVVAMFAAPD